MSLSDKEIRKIIEEANEDISSVDLLKKETDESSTD